MADERTTGVAAAGRRPRRCFVVFDRRRCLQSRERRFDADDVVVVVSAAAAVGRSTVAGSTVGFADVAAVDELCWRLHQVLDEIERKVGIYSTNNQNYARLTNARLAFLIKSARFRI